MQKSFKILLHSGFWLSYLLLVAIVMFAALQGTAIEPGDEAYYFSFIVGIGILPPVISFYAHANYLFPQYLQKRKIPLSIIIGLVLASGAALLGLLFIKLTSAEAFGCVQGGMPYSIIFPTALSVVFGVIALVLKGFLTWYEELKLKEELLEKTHRMELALVKSQLDPHFLFNTINNIDVLISKRPEEASLYLNKLSDIMRFMLYETKAEQIPLTQELEYIEKYIQLQKIRTANDNYVNFDIVGKATKKQVAPMVFIPFIENAFKHATNKKIDHAVDIDIQIAEHAITFSCQNKYDPHKTTLNGYHGLGNELIKRRLNLLYPQKHSLKVDRQENQYKVELTLLNGTV